MKDERFLNKLLTIPALPLSELNLNESFEAEKQLLKEKGVNIFEFIPFSFESLLDTIYIPFIEPEVYPNLYKLLTFLKEEREYTNWNKFRDLLNTRVFLYLKLADGYVTLDNYQHVATIYKQFLNSLPKENKVYSLIDFTEIKIDPHIRLRLQPIEEIQLQPNLAHQSVILDEVPGILRFIIKIYLGYKKVMSGDPGQILKPDEAIASLEYPAKQLLAELLEV